MSQPNSDLIFKAMDSVYSPKPNSWKKVFLYLALSVISGLGIGILIVSSPQLSDWWGCYIKRTQFSPGTSIESIKHWCDWLATVFQIVIVASIGGVIFTEGSAQFFRRFSDRLNEHIENSTENNTKERSEFVRETVERIEYIASSNNHNIVKAGQIIRLQYDLFQKAILLPNYYYWFIFRGLIVNFPGGLYGLLAFMFLFLQILTITTKMSLDYISQNTCS